MLSPGQTVSLQSFMVGMALCSVVLLLCLMTTYLFREKRQRTSAWLLSFAFCSACLLICALRLFTLFGVDFDDLLVEGGTLCLVQATLTQFAACSSVGFWFLITINLYRVLLKRAVLKTSSTVLQLLAVVGISLVATAIPLFNGALGPQAPFFCWYSAKKWVWAFAGFFVWLILVLSIGFVLWLRIVIAIRRTKSNAERYLLEREARPFGSVGAAGSMSGTGRSPRAGGASAAGGGESASASGTSGRGRRSGVGFGRVGRPAASSSAGGGGKAHVHVSYVRHVVFVILFFLVCLVMIINDLYAKLSGNTSSFGFWLVDIFAISGIGVWVFIAIGVSRVNFVLWKHFIARRCCCCCCRSNDAVNAGSIYR